jgi:hypothetical protein
MGQSRRASEREDAMHKLITAVVGLVSTDEAEQDRT